MTWGTAFNGIAHAVSTALDTFWQRVEVAATNLRLRLVESELDDVARDITRFYKRCRAEHLRQCRELAAAERRTLLLRARLPERHDADPRPRRRVCASSERWRVMYA
jgi:hypothetical protein